MKTILPVLALLYSFLLWGISQNGLNHNEKDLTESKISKLKAEAVEEHSELYFMHGIQISKRFCFFGYPNNCEEGEVVDSDTLNTAFLVRVTFNSDKPDSVLFDGLEGANTKPREMVSDGFNGGSAAYLNCTSPSINCGYVRKTGNELEFDLNSPGGSYFGTGTLNNDRLTIRTQYYYRGSGAEYILEGQKIVEEK